MFGWVRPNRPGRGWAKGSQGLGSETMRSVPAPPRPVGGLTRAAEAADRTPGQTPVAHPALQRALMLCDVLPAESRLKRTSIGYTASRSRAPKPQSAPGLGRAAESMTDPSASPRLALPRARWAWNGHVNPIGPQQPLIGVATNYRITGGGSARSGAVWRGLHAANHPCNPLIRLAAHWGQTRQRREP